VPEAFQFDPFDPKQTQNMWHQFRDLRENNPISRPGDFVFVTRYDDVKAVLRKPRAFGNSQGFRAPGVEVPVEDRLVGELDAPLHRPIRRLLTDILTPRIVENARAFTRATARAQLENLAGRGRGDLVRDFTLLLPTQVTVHILGLPVEDSPQLSQWANELLHSDWPAYNRTERGEGLVGAFPEYAAYIDRHVDERRDSSDPPDDLITGLIRQRLFDEPVSSRQIRALVSNLILGGISTSTNMLGNLLHHLLRNPADFRALRAKPELAATAVEESLRLMPPILYVVRTCTIPTEISGFKIEAGERVICSLASANRDDRIFPDPDSFRLDREKPAAHMSFSFGPHLCLGASSARMVGQVVTEEFTQHFDCDQISLSPEYRFEGVPVFMEYGPGELPVSLRGNS